jgi:hypothetical protein
MNKILRNSIVLPVALGTLLATGFAAGAAPARQHPQHQDKHQDKKELRQDKREVRQDKREVHQDRKDVRRDIRQGDRHDLHQDRKDVRQDRREVRQDRREVRQDIRRDVRPVVRPTIRQDRRDVRQDIRQDRRDVRQDIRQDRREVRQDIRHDRREVRQDRRAQQRYRDDYYRRLRLLQSRSYVPQYYRSGNYRYNRGGQWYRVNYYGADMLHNAIEQGYREGLRAGSADRYDGWRGGYRSSAVWVDANFGYRGSYVSRSEYNYYFRQGFERGYEDGLYGRYRYGRSVNGEALIIDAVLAAILNMQRY